MHTVDVQLFRTKLGAIIIQIFDPLTHQTVKCDISKVYFTLLVDLLKTNKHIDYVDETGKFQISMKQTEKAPEKKYYLHWRQF